MCVCVCVCVFVCGCVCACVCVCVCVCVCSSMLNSVFNTSRTATPATLTEPMCHLHCQLTKLIDTCQPVPFQYTTQPQGRQSLIYLSLCHQVAHRQQRKPPLFHDHRLVGLTVWKQPRCVKLLAAISISRYKSTCLYGLVGYIIAN